MHTNLERAPYRQVNLDGLKLDAAAGGTTPYVITLSWNQSLCWSHH